MKTLPEVRTVQHLINGEFVGGMSGRTFQSLNPATNTPIAGVAAAPGKMSAAPYRRLAGRSMKAPGRGWRRPTAPAPCTASPT